jgi:heterodisulfide reductase subunit B
MKYAYYPGCSLHGACGPYDRSLRRVMEILEQELVEIDDWNCCGATVYMGVQESVALAVSARNLALAGGVDILAPCSACYTTLQKTNRYLREVPELRRAVGGALRDVKLAYDGNTAVRHPLDVIVNHIGIAAVLRKARRRLDGLRFAPYYGCQIVRPEPPFDDRDWPTSLDELFGALGAEPVYFPARVRCCGGMLTTTQPDVGKELSREILAAAARNGAELVVTTCPLCHVNLEAVQVGRKGNGDGTAPMPVLFFTQLLGLALGESAKSMELGKSLVPLGRVAALAGAAT